MRHLSGLEESEQWEITILNKNIETRLIWRLSFCLRPFTN